MVALLAPEVEEVVLVRARSEVVEDNDVVLVALNDMVELVKVMTVVLVCVVSTGIVMVRELVRVIVTMFVLINVVTTVMTLRVRVEVFAAVVWFKEKDDSGGFALAVVGHGGVVLLRVGITNDRE